MSLTDTTAGPINPLLAAARTGSGTRTTGEIVPLTLTPLGESPADVRSQLDAQTRDVVAMRAQIQALEDRQRLLLIALVVATGAAVYMWSKRK